MSNQLKIIALLVGTIAICSCKKKDIIPCTEMKPIVIPYATTDTIIYTVVKGSTVPIYLSIPACNSTDYPAVVLLHGSGGMWKNDDRNSGIMSSQNREWKEIFNTNCIVGAYIDSYTPRGCIERVDEWKNAPKAFEISSQFVRPYDAYSGLEILRSLVRPDGSSIVRTNDIGLLGFSDGATALAATLYDTETTPSDWEWTQTYDKEYTEANGIGKPAVRPDKGGFSCGVFYYGGSVGNSYWGSNPCTNSENYIYRNYAPILYQLPENGYLTENTLCSYSILENKGMEVDKVIYPNATHGFDGNDGGEKAQSDEARIKTIEWFSKYLHIE